MLISKTIKTKWNSKTKSYYESLGYKYTKMHDDFEVKVEDLKPWSAERVLVKCDYCGNIYDVGWGSYRKLKEKINNTDCCNNPLCTGKKAEESMFLLNGVKSCRELDYVNQKIKDTNIIKYGCENPFGNKEVQDKIKKYYIDNYGVEHSMQVDEIKVKSRNTCLERYGVKNYSQTEEFRFNMRKENNPRWKDYVRKKERTDRDMPEYRDWRKDVFDRDLYTCQCCGARNGNGKYIYLEAHHILNYKDNENKRFDVNNGITLCKRCHIDFHKIYGKRNNNKKQLDEFINNYIDEKIC